jgi:hypothetical protein
MSVNALLINTHVQVSPDAKIYAFSDIHADMHSLIILLRDCAQVIKKKEIKYKFNQKELDSDVEIYLEIDLNSETDTNYIDDLNYEWCGGINIVVIIGDILDGIRLDRENKIHSGTRKDSNMYNHEYPQIELKILRFINALNEQAMSHDGRIYKVLGNHEVMNIQGDMRYAFPRDVNNSIYYNKTNRTKIFEYNNYGHEILFKDFCYSLLMLNNFIFVHGQLVDDKDYNYYNELNININSNNNNSFTRALKILSDAKSQLWMREYGLDKEAHDRFVKIRNENELDDTMILKDMTIFNDKEEKTNFCIKVNKNFEKFLIGCPTKYKNEDIKIIIGHCPQNYLSQNKNYGTSLIGIQSQDSVRRTLTLPAMNGKYGSDENLIFGISMECAKNGQHQIYKVDAGTSRGFDNRGELASVAFNEVNDDKSEIKKEHEHYTFKRTLFSRTPQTIEIFNNGVNIIKSRFKNTRIHQPRYELEQYINRDAKLASKLRIDTDEYFKKYLKYKNKYMSFKKK